jgi:hypothetical protein
MFETLQVDGRLGIKLAYDESASETFEVIQSTNRPTVPRAASAHYEGFAECH